VAELKIEPGGSASVYVLHEGYVGRDGDDERVAGTVTLIVDGDAVIVVDPGMVASREALLAALAAHGPQAGDVTDVVFSHHHPDHTVNAALFPTARIHDHWAVYVGDRWIDRDANGAELGPSVRLLRTPGHTAEDMSYACKGQLALRWYHRGKTIWRCHYATDCRRPLESPVRQHHQRGHPGREPRRVRAPERAQDRQSYIRPGRIGREADHEAPGRRPVV